MQGLEMAREGASVDWGVTGRREARAEGSVGAIDTGPGIACSGCRETTVERDDVGSVGWGNNRTWTLCFMCGEEMCLSCLAHMHECHDCADAVLREQGREAYARAWACEDAQDAIRRKGDWREEVFTVVGGTPAE